MKVIVDHIEKQAPHILTVYLRPELHFSYIAGQFIKLTIDHPNPDNRGIWRWFTLSSSPTEKLLSITAKVDLQNGTTFTEALLHASPGDEFEIDGPEGDFIMPEDLGTPLIFVAGGIGITPFRSMFKWLDAVGQQRNITLFYGVNEERDIICRSTLNALGANAVVSVINPSDSWEGNRGFLRVEDVFKAAQQAPQSLIFISGPELMVENMQRALIDMGIEPERLKLDAFRGIEGV